MSIALCKLYYVKLGCQILVAATISCVGAAAAALSNFFYQLHKLHQLQLQNQLANCTKNPALSCKNFVILPIVKTLDKIEIL